MLMDDGLQKPGELNITYTIAKLHEIRQLVDAGMRENEQLREQNRIMRAALRKIYAFAGNVGDAAHIESAARFALREAGEEV